MRLLRSSLVAVLFTFALAVFAASEPLAQKLLPPQGSVKDFTISPGSLVYAKGQDLTEIYDGAVDVYTKNGVVDAARQAYQRKDDFAEVTVHTMKSSKAALDFLKYWQKQNKVKSLTKTKTRTSFLVSNPSVTLYFVVGKYLVTVGAFYQHTQARKDVAAFADVIEKRILKYGGR